MTAARDTMAAGDLLLSIAQELGRCQSLVGAVEHAVEHLPPSGWHPDLQDIDLLHQTLNDLASLLSAVAAERDLLGVTLGDAEHLIAPLRLGAVRARLRGEPAAPPPPERTAHVELF